MRLYRNISIEKKTESSENSDIQNIQMIQLLLKYSFQAGWLVFFVFIVFLFRYDQSSKKLVFPLSRVVVEDYFTRIFLPLWM